MTKITKEINFGEHTLVLETGEIARQASGAVLANVNGTQVLVTVVGNKEANENTNFFPLTVNYQEKYFAAGKIPGGFNKREARPRENEILVSRLIDRPLRPLFPEYFYNEVQITATALSFNPEVPPDIVAMIGASAALTIARIPFYGPIGAVRVGYKNGIYTLNPSYADLAKSDLDLVIAGTADAILMVEAQARELNEETMLAGILYGHEMMQSVIKAIKEMADEAAKPAWEWQPPEINNDLEKHITDLVQKPFQDAYAINDKLERQQRISDLKEEIINAVSNENAEANIQQVADIINKIEKILIRQAILDGEPRIDGRDRKTVRPINIRTAILERTHGSALFTRGETQALSVTTLGNERDAQILDDLSGEIKDRFMLHYNFPPYAVGETGNSGSPKRREIGHGRLAKRALMAVLPKIEDFPYVLRVVSEITESNGSSSMATVCATSLSLMDAGVPIQTPVAGIAMGLIKEHEQFAILTDIIGDEDHLGDMDFKVAGTKKGITALQMDIKITGITKEIMEQALEQALNGRLHILDIMDRALSAPRATLSNYAPRIMTMKIAEDKIRNIIGKGGATIKGLIESTGVNIDIDERGVVQLFSPNITALEEAQRQIKSLIAEIEIGQTYTGKVSKIVEFGAFINILPGKDALLHISQICDRSIKIEDVLTEGQEINILVVGIDRQGRMKLEWLDKKQQSTDIKKNDNKEEVDN